MNGASQNDIDKKQAFLLGFEVFAACHKKELQKLADKLVYVEYKPGIGE